MELSQSNTGIALPSESMPKVSILNFQLNGSGSLPNEKSTAPLIPAIVNNIYTEVLNCILPIGVVEIESITHLESPVQLAESSNELNYDTQQAVVITSPALTIANFVKNKDANKMSPAQYRLEHFKLTQSYKALNEFFQSPTQLLSFVNRSIACCAQQLAFAYVNRIQFSKLSPENLCIDGRLKDMSECNVSFRTTLENLDSTLIEQRRSLISAFLNWLNHYNTFNQGQIDTNKIAEQFEGLYNKYLNYYSLSIFGFIDEEVPLHSRYREDLTDFLQNCYQYEHAGDLLIESIANAYFHSVQNESYCTRNNIALPINELIDELMAEEVYSYPRYSLVSSLLIKSLRRILFSPLFENSNLTEAVKVQVKHKGIDKLPDLSVSYCHSVRWIFGLEDSQVHTMLFKNSKALVYFVPITQSYIVEQLKNGRKYSFSNASELSIYINNESKLLFDLPGFLAWPKLNLLIQKLKALESANSHRLERNM